MDPGRAGSIVTRECDLFPDVFPLTPSLSEGKSPPQTEPENHHLLVQETLRLLLGPGYGKATGVVPSEQKCRLSWEIF